MPKRNKRLEKQDKWARALAMRQDGKHAGDKVCEPDAAVKHQTGNSEADVHSDSGLSTSNSLACENTGDDCGTLFDTDVLNNLRSNQTILKWPTDHVMEHANSGSSSSGTASVVSVVPHYEQRFAQLESLVKTQNEKIELLLGLMYANIARTGSGMTDTSGYCGIQSNACSTPIHDNFNNGLDEDTLVNDLDTSTNTLTGSVDATTVALADAGASMSDKSDIRASTSAAIPVVRNELVSDTLTAFLPNIASFCDIDNVEPVPIRPPPGFTPINGTTQLHALHANTFEIQTPQEIVAEFAINAEPVTHFAPLDNFVIAELRNDSKTPTNTTSATTPDMLTDSEPVLVCAAEFASLLTDALQDTPITKDEQENTCEQKIVEDMTKSATVPLKILKRVNFTVIIKQLYTILLSFAGFVFRTRTYHIVGEHLNILQYIWMPIAILLFQIYSYLFGNTITITANRFYIEHLNAHGMDFKQSYIKYNELYSFACSLWTWYYYVIYFQIGAWFITQTCRFMGPIIPNSPLSLPLYYINICFYRLYDYYLFYRNDPRSDYIYTNTSILNRKTAKVIEEGFCCMCHIYGHTYRQHSGRLTKFDVSPNAIAHSRLQSVFALTTFFNMPKNNDLIYSEGALTFSDVYTFIKNSMRYTNVNCLQPYRTNNILPTPFAITTKDVPADFTSVAIADLTVYLNTDPNCPHYCIVKCNEGAVENAINSLVSYHIDSVTVYQCEIAIPRTITNFAQVKEALIFSNERNNTNATIARDFCKKQHMINNNHDDTSSVCSDYIRSATFGPRQFRRNQVRTQAYILTLSNTDQDVQSSDIMICGHEDDGMVIQYISDRVYNPIYYAFMSGVYFLFALFSLFYRCIKFAYNNAFVRAIIFVLCIVHFAGYVTANDAVRTNVDIFTVTRNDGDICSEHNEYNHDLDYHNGRYLMQYLDNGLYTINNDSEHPLSLSEISNLYTCINFNHTPISCSSYYNLQQSCNVFKLAQHYGKVGHDERNIKVRAHERSSIIKHLMYEQHVYQIRDDGANYNESAIGFYENALPDNLLCLRNVFGIVIGDDDYWPLDYFKTSSLTYYTFYGVDTIVHCDSGPFIRPVLTFTYRDCKLLEEENNEEQVIPTITLSDELVQRTSTLINHRAALLKHRTNVAYIEASALIPDRFMVDCFDDPLLERIDDKCFINRRNLIVVTYRTYYAFVIECLHNDVRCNNIGDFASNTQPSKATKHMHAVRENVDFVVNKTANVTNEIINTTTAFTHHVVNVVNTIKGHISNNTERLHPIIDIPLQQYQRFSFSILRLFDIIVLRTYHLLRDIGITTTKCAIYDHPDMQVLYDDCNADVLDLKRLRFHRINLYSNNTYEVFITNDHDFNTISRSIGFTYNNTARSYFRYMNYQPGTYALHFLKLEKLEWCMSATYAPFFEAEQCIAYSTGFYYLDALCSVVKIYDILCIIFICWCLYYIGVCGANGFNLRFAITIIVMVGVWFDSRYFDFMHTNTLAFCVMVVACINLCSFVAHFSSSFSRRNLNIFTICGEVGIAIMLVYTFIFVGSGYLFYFFILCCVCLLYSIAAKQPWDMHILIRSDAIKYWDAYMNDNDEKNGATAYDKLRRKINNMRMHEITTNAYRQARFLINCYELINNSTRNDMILPHEAYATVGREYDSKFTVVKENIVKVEGLTMRTLPIPIDHMTMLTQHSSRIISLRYCNNMLYGFCLDGHIYIERHLFVNDETVIDYQFKPENIDFSLLKICSGFARDLVMDYGRVKINEGFIILPYTGYNECNANFKFHTAPLTFQGHGFIVSSTGGAYAMRIDAGKHDGNTMAGHCGLPIFGLANGSLQFLGLHCASVGYDFDDKFWSTVFDMNISINFFTTLDGSTGGIEGFDIRPVVPQLTRPVLDPITTGIELTRLHAGQIQTPYNPILLDAFGIDKTTYRVNHMNISYAYCLEHVSEWCMRRYNHGFSFAQYLICGSPEIDINNIAIKAEFMRFLQPRLTGTYILSIFNFLYAVFGFLFLSSYNVIDLQSSVLGYAMPGISFVFSIWQIFSLVFVCRNIGLHRWSRVLLIVLRDIVYLFLLFPHCKHSENVANLNQFNILTNQPEQFDLKHTCFDSSYNQLDKIRVSITDNWQARGYNIYHIDNVEHGYFDLLFIKGIYNVFVQYSYGFSFSEACFMNYAVCTSPVYGFLNVLFFALCLMTFVNNARDIYRVLCNLLKHPATRNLRGIAKAICAEGVELKSIKKRLNMVLNITKILSGYENYFDFRTYVGNLEEIRARDEYTREDEEYIDSVIAQLQCRFRPLLDVYQPLSHLGDNMIITCLMAGINAKTGALDVNVTKRFTDDVTQLYDSCQQQVIGEYVELRDVDTKQLINDIRALDLISVKALQKPTTVAIAEAMYQEQLIALFPELVNRIDDMDDTIAVVKGFIQLIGGSRDDEDFCSRVYAAYNDLIKLDTALLSDNSDLSRRNFNTLKSEIECLNSRLTKIYNRFEQLLKERQQREIKDLNRSDNLHRERAKAEIAMQRKAANVARALHMLVRYYVTIDAHSVVQNMALKNLIGVVSEYAGVKSIEMPLLINSKDAVNTVSVYAEADVQYGIFNGDSFSALPAMCGIILQCKQIHQHGYNTCYKHLMSLYQEHTDNCRSCLSSYIARLHPCCGATYNTKGGFSPSFNAHLRRYYSCKQCLLCDDCRHEDYRRSKICDSPFHHVKSIGDRASVSTEMFIAPAISDTNRLEFVVHNINDVPFNVVILNGRLLVARCKKSYNAEAPVGLYKMRFIADISGDDFDYFCARNLVDADIIRAALKGLSQQIAAVAESIQEPAKAATSNHNTPNFMRGVQKEPVTQNAIISSESFVNAQHPNMPTSITSALTSLRTEHQAACTTTTDSSLIQNLKHITPLNIPSTSGCASVRTQLF